MDETPPPHQVEWQGHRGARGLAPENTIPAFLLALEYQQVEVLELDVVISADSQVVVSHEPWMSSTICSHPDGRAVTEEEEDELNIFQMSLAEVQAYDCGKRGNPRFPEQRPMPAIKPTLAAVVKAVEDRLANLERSAPSYNIELKSRPEWDGIFAPPPPVFTKLVLEQVRQLGIQKRSVLQSFDPRILRELHQLDSTLTLALLVENTSSLQNNLDDLDFQPTIYSPHYMLVSANLVKQIHEREMKLIPWTVNDTTAMRGMIELGVDGIITDYPNRIPLVQE